MHPLSWVKETHLIPFFKFSVAFTFAIMLLLNHMCAPLQNAEFAPLGILSFEFVVSADNAKTMLASWSGTTRTWLAVALGFDYLFMISYSFCIAAGCILAGYKLPTLQKPAVLLAWLQIAAAISDSIENAASISMLIQTPTDSAALISTVCASIKFSFVIAGILFACAVYFLPRAKR